MILSPLLTSDLPEGQETCDLWWVSEDGKTVCRHHHVPRSQLFTPCHEGCPAPVSQLGPTRTAVFRGVEDVLSREHCDDWMCSSTAHEVIGDKPWIGTTTFQVAPPPLPTASCAEQESGCSEALTGEWSAKQFRSVKSSARKAAAQLEPEHQKSQSIYDVVEVFSPPRFGVIGATKGISCLSADLLTGRDFRRPADRDSMRKLIKGNTPKLLVLLPPCTWAGGWFHLNRCLMEPAERRRKEVLTRLFLNFCAELAEIQLDRGGRVLFEHPIGSLAWRMPRWRQLSQRMFQVDLDMRCFGMRVPNGKLIKKATRLLVSHANMKYLGKRCPGERERLHAQHQVVEGSLSGIGSVSTYAGIPQPLRAQCCGQ